MTQIQGAILSRSACKNHLWGEGGGVGEGERGK